MSGAESGFCTRLEVTSLFRLQPEQLVFPINTPVHLTTVNGTRHRVRLIIELGGGASLDVELLPGASPTWRVSSGVAGYHVIAALPRRGDFGPPSIHGALLVTPRGTAVEPEATKQLIGLATTILTFTAAIAFAEDLFTNLRQVVRFEIIAAWGLYLVSAGLGVWNLWSGRIKRRDLQAEQGIAFAVATFVLVVGAATALVAPAPSVAYRLGTVHQFVEAGSRNPATFGATLSGGPDAGAGDADLPLLHLAGTAGPVAGVGCFEALVQRYRLVLPDFAIDVDGLTEKGDWVEVRYRVSGHTPTGRAVELAGAGFVRLDIDGATVRVREDFGIFDQRGALVGYEEPPGAVAPETVAPPVSAGYCTDPRLAGVPIFPSPAL